jgi:hypothetical protein
LIAGLPYENEYWVLGYMFPEVELMRAEKERRRDWHGVAGIWKRHWKGIVTGVLVAVLFFDALENWLGNRGITETVVAWAENMAEGENATAGETKSEENVSETADFNTEENPVIVIGSNSGLYKEAGENTTGDVSGPITGNPTDETGYYYTLDDTTYEATAHIVGGSISVETKTLTIPAYIQVATRTRQGRVISWAKGDIYKVTAVEGEGAEEEVNTSVTQISLPSTLTTIGAHAFTGMTALEEIQVPD